MRISDWSSDVCSSDLENGKLTGTVAKPIVDSAAKEKALVDSAAALGIPLTQTLAIGDGANDLPMIRTAGLCVSYRAKPVVAAAAASPLDHSVLSAFLSSPGFPFASLDLSLFSCLPFFFPPFLLSLPSF